ncbi:hypothetical protein MtrunA17_Chr8g0339561 [Medicago truncatula]|uniref:Uncharacterized protein n=1 Tax=Medicago truncatula TaxID=3880 RepID=A0A396GBQ8_MEDTR|nr:hypothetical protein MtrunA17_Chr8g0339561 [Medicago truncatula]
MFFFFSKGLMRLYFVERRCDFGTTVLWGEFFLKRERVLINVYSYRCYCLATPPKKIK